MGRVALLAWSLLGLYVAMTAWEFYQMFYPSLVARPGEHVFQSSWGAQRQRATGTGAGRTQLYGLKLCVSSRSDQISPDDLQSGCVYARDDLQLNDSLDATFDFALPTRFLTPFVALQERYATLHSQIQDEQRRQEQRDESGGGGRDAPPKGVGVSAVTAALMEQLKEVREQLHSSGLFLHSFLYRIDPDAAAALSASNPAFVHYSTMKADPWHVHSATPLLVRRLVDLNHTRNLLSGSSDSADGVQEGDSSAKLNASTSVAAVSPRKQLVHFLRPRLHIQLMGADLSFPASRVPHDLAHFFPSRRAAASVRQYYSPMVRVQEMLLLRREWLPLNRSVLEEVDQVAAAAAAAKGGLRRATPIVREGGGGDSATHDAVFTTTPATQPGVSDALVLLAVADATAPTGAPLPPSLKPVLTADGVTLTVSLQAVSLGWFRLLNQMAHSMNLLAQAQAALQLDPSSLAMTESRRSSLAQQMHDLRSHAHMEEDALGAELEDVKTMFVDSNPLLLLLTLVISVVHLVLDLLAFKSDVSFWRSRNNNYSGISARAVWINAAVRTVLFLYLLDQDASRLVLFSSALSLAISVWKAVKILRISVALSSSFPFVLRFGAPTAAESLTQQHDSAAMKWLGVLAAPLVLGAALWSLVYHAHKSWYSWMLGSCASAVYVGGFVLMTPQLFVNYKLKSVAHMPLRVFIYRACNTFIDDIFSFIIPMPTMHRLACFRDDIVFFVYLYQRWIYPTDHSRTIVAVEDDEEGEQMQRLQPPAGQALAEGEGQKQQTQPEAVPLLSPAGSVGDEKSAPVLAQVAAPTLGDDDIDTAAALGPLAADATESVLTRRHAAAAASSSSSD